MSIRIAISVPRLSLHCQLGNDSEGINGAVPTIRVYVIPNAKVDMVFGEYRGAIKIKLKTEGDLLGR